jgi:hypothetical protein
MNKKEFQQEIKNSAADAVERANKANYIKERI